MEPGQWEGLISLALGLYTLLVSTGTVKVSKSPDGNAAFLRRYRWVFILATIFLLARSATYLARLYW